MSAKGRDALVVACLAVAAACTPAGPKPEATADAIYSGGPIVTVDDARPSAEALAVKDGKILAVGAKSEIEKAHKGRATRLVDLGGRALLPGFIDAHGHAFNAGVQKLAANLLPPPDGAGKDVASVVALLEEWKGRNAPAIEKAGWIIGFGYDDSQLARAPPPHRGGPRPRVDRGARGDHPPVGPPRRHEPQGARGGGRGRRHEGPAGRRHPSREGRRDPERGARGDGLLRPDLRRARRRSTRRPTRGSRSPAPPSYAGFGFTTAQEGRASRAGERDVAQARLPQGRLDIDVAAYPDILGRGRVPGAGARHGRGRTPAASGSAAAKLSLDGSPQGKTAWLTRPYLVPPRRTAEDLRGLSRHPESRGSRSAGRPRLREGLASARPLQRRRGGGRVHRRRGEGRGEARARRIGAR